MQTLIVLVTLFVLGVVSQPHGIRFLHGSMDAPAIDIYLQGVPVKLGLYFEEVTDYILIDANVSQAVTLKVANDWVPFKEFTIPHTEFNVSNPQTVILYGLYPDLFWRMIEQHCTPHGRGAWVNTLHLHHGLDHVDVSIDAGAICNGIDPNSNRILWTDVEYEELTDMRLIPTPSKGPFNVNISLTRVPHPMVWQGSLWTEMGHTYTIIPLGEEVVDRFSACSSRGTGAMPSCPEYYIRYPTVFILDSGFSSTCSTHYP
eukprot:TRINITY_DN2024_c1_g1_i1.p1 TRINITY_DN2024_c1_g1~~TRINITY_DN2024_c1_g1_i1.p1  ORF type:complete len:259 (+),score=29.50 TRINITY_DN2024_c1_g1_i1:58-834(+)